MPQRYGFSVEMMERRTINLKMYNSFRDGTKAQVEMTALATQGASMDEAMCKGRSSLDDSIGSLALCIVRSQPRAAPRTDHAGQSERGGGIDEEQELCHQHETRR